jgi:phosphoserine phosphatase RsbU/P
MVAGEKSESKLRIARKIQLSLIPNSFSDLPQVSLLAMFKSAREVDGGKYDFFVLEKDKFCFAIGDVSGKGVSASLLVEVPKLCSCQLPTR